MSHFLTIWGMNGSFTNNPSSIIRTIWIGTGESYCLRLFMKIWSGWGMYKENNLIFIQKTMLAKVQNTASIDAYVINTVLPDTCCLEKRWNNRLAIVWPMTTDRKIITISVNSEKSLRKINIIATKRIMELASVMKKRCLFKWISPFSNWYVYAEEKIQRNGGLFQSKQSI